MVSRLSERCFPSALVFSAILLGLSCMVAPVLPAQAQKEEPVNLATAVARVARDNIPAVVHIEVRQHQELSNSGLPFENGPFFPRSFDHGRMPWKFKRELKRLGTGMIMDDLGYILTNNHVVGGAIEIQVLLSNGKRYPAEVVGTDPKTDLAVIRVVTEEAVPYVTLGDSDEVEIGDWVIAIGHSRAVGQTVTQGIISAKHRKGIWDPSSYKDFLQTDAAINPGNTGGPLLNLQGEVVGVNEAIVPQSGRFEGIGFAIPSNIALHIAEELIAQGKVERGWLGVSVQDLTPEIAESLSIKWRRGALIADVVKGGPADQAGIRRGDVVILYQGKSIMDGNFLRSEVAVSPIGQDALLTVMRGGQKLELQTRIGSPDEAIEKVASSIKARLGVDVRPVTSREMDRYGLDCPEGVVIMWLDRTGPLGRVGFEVNDVIMEINGKAFAGLDGFADLVNSLRTSQWITLLALDHRSGRIGYVQVVAE